MAGKREGGIKARETNYAKYGEDYYAVMGKKGGAVHHPETRAFTVDRELARRAGAIGGRISKRGPAKQSEAKRKSKLRSIIKGFYRIFY